MNEFDAIEVHVRRARLQRSAAFGDLLAGAILAVWFGAKRLAQSASAKISGLVETPDEYLTALPLTALPRHS